MLTDQMKAILDEHAAMGPLPIETLTPEIARQIPLADRAALAYYGHHIAKRAFAPLPLPVGRIEHKTIRGAGGDILTRIYTPKGDAPSGGWPVVVYFHGGGWVVATLDTYDSSCRALCDGANSVVVSVHYRQAPEHPYPAAVEDAVEAWQWVASNAQALNANPNKIAVAGESAGGNLAAVVTLIARDKGLTMPCHQVLVYPVTDLMHGPESVSAQENATAKPLNTPMLNWFYDLYVPDSVDKTEPYLSPLYATDFTGLPPSTVILAEIDPLRSDGEAYAAKLRQGGNAVNLHIYPGVTHEFFGMAGLLDEATKAVKEVVTDLRNAFDDRVRHAA